MAEPIYDDPENLERVRAVAISAEAVCRGILIRWEKKPANYLGLLKLACGLLWFRRYRRLTAT